MSYSIGADGHYTSPRQPLSPMPVSLSAITHPAQLITKNTHVAVLGLSGDVQHLLVYQHLKLYQTHLRIITFEITAAWGWAMFVINTFLTGSILCRIMSVRNFPPSISSPCALISTARADGACIPLLSNNSHISRIYYICPAEIGAHIARYSTGTSHGRAARRPPCLSRRACTAQ